MRACIGNWQKLIILYDSKDNKFKITIGWKIVLPVTTEQMHRSAGKSAWWKDLGRHIEFVSHLIIVKIIFRCYIDEHVTLLRDIKEQPVIVVVFIFNPTYMYVFFILVPLTFPKCWF